MNWKGFRRKQFWPTLRLCPVENHVECVVITVFRRVRNEMSNKCGLERSLLELTCLICNGEETMPMNYYIVYSGACLSWNTLAVNSKSFFQQF